MTKREKLLWDIQQLLFGFREETDMDFVVKEIDKLMAEYEAPLYPMCGKPLSDNHVHGAECLGDVYINETFKI